MMEPQKSFSSRRKATEELPAFSLPPRTSNIPRAGDGISPSLSSVNTTSSQGSQAAPAVHSQYTFNSQMQGSWPTPGNYTISSGTGPTRPGLQDYANNNNNNRQALFGQQSLSYRSSQSPATGPEGLPAPFEHASQAQPSQPGAQVPLPQVQQHPFQTSILPSSLPGGSGGGGHPHQVPHAANTQSVGQIQPYSSTQSQTAGPVESYAQARSPPGPAYHLSSGAPHASFPPSFAPLPSPNSHSHSQSPLPSSGSASNPRSLGAISASPLQNPLSAMAHPQPYRSYPPSAGYQSLAHPNAPGPVLSNVPQPGNQMSMMSGIAVSHQYPGHGLVYTHNQPQVAQDRPFRCEHCNQTFSRNHDLKRHKRIHLQVKPFPCTYCTKTFSRKDALKRHRLVKGCEAKFNEQNGPKKDGQDRGGSDVDDASNSTKSPES